MLGITQGTLSKSTEKLSSGYKVNRAADDAAGLAISEKMRKQIRGLTQASANAEDGISAVQTAEGALTEVHDMLQRMNELATKAANGTMSLDDRQTVQDEVDQLTTEIDRVAETTKFNEIYLLKGEKSSNAKTQYLAGHDAGIDGTLRDGATTATLTISKLHVGDTVTIGGKSYTIGDTKDNIISSVEAYDSAGTQINIDGVQYTVAGEAGADDEKNILDIDDITAKITDNSVVVVGGKTYNAMATGKDIDPNDSSVITADQAYKYMVEQLTIANNVGTDATLSGGASGLATVADATENADDNTKMDFVISKGQRNITEALNFNLHVGADADANNKIGVTIEAMDAAGLGIKGLNVKDSTGASATYAIDSIADAIAKVSAQRSALGAVQNRLEHTINNLDNVVENTTSAESQIRDTDMATEMVKYSNANILAQAGQSMLAQANQSNQGVLSLLG
jgi:flagellin